MVNAKIEKEEFHVGNPRQDMKMAWGEVKRAHYGYLMVTCAFQQS